MALARAIAVRPRVLLLDEPLTALDAKLRDSLRVEIDSLLHSVGITSVYVTHDQAEAMALGNRIVVMSQGRIAQVGTPRDIYFRPANRFVAEFIGSVNKIRCQRRSNRLEFQGGSIGLPPGLGGKIEAEGQVEIYFRPEHAAVVEPERGDFVASVAGSFFLGDRTMIFLNGSMTEGLRVEAPGRSTYKTGEKIGVSLDSESVFILTE